MKKSLFPIIAVILSPATALCTGIEQAYQDATAAARGNTGTASIRSSAGVFYNPAALALLKRSEFQATFFGTLPNTTYSGATGNTSADDRLRPAGSLFGAIPIESLNGVLGFGLTIPHGLGIEYPDSSPLRSVGIEAELAHAVFTATYSTQITETLSFGAGISYAYNDVKTRQGIVTPGDFLELNATGDGWGYTAGLLYTPHPNHSFGLTYRSAIKVDFKGDLETNALLPVSFNTTESARTDIEYPDQIAMGYAWQINDKWNAEINATWTNWDTFDDLTIRAESQTISSPWGYKPNWVIGVGTSYVVNEKLTLHGGYLYGESVVPDAFLTPFVPESDLHVFSIGATYNHDNWSLTGAYLLGFREDRTVSGSPASPFTRVSADGDYETDAQTFLISLKRTF